MGGLPKQATREAGPLDEEGATLAAVWGSLDWGFRLNPLQLQVLGSCEHSLLYCY